MATDQECLRVAHEYARLAGLTKHRNVWDQLLDLARSKSPRAAEYLHCAKECADTAERTTDPKVRETLLKVVADLTAAALSAASSGSTPLKSGSPSRAA
jgi:hypothetical protein